VYIELLEESGVRVTPDMHERYLGVADKDAIADLTAHEGLVLPAGLLERMQQRKMEEYAKGAVPIPGATHAVLRVVAAGVPFCVATSGTLAETVVKLKTAGLFEHFGDRIFSRESVSRGKPAPDLFLHAGTTMGVSPPACVVVEDSLAGVRGALEAGMRVLGFVPRRDWQGLDDAGAEVFPSMAEVPSLLGL
jgi:HAD superfamily hydrolase (TIGR01509 family)